MFAKFLVALAAIGLLAVEAKSMEKKSASETHVKAAAPTRMNVASHALKTKVAKALAQAPHRKEKKSKKAIEAHIAARTAAKKAKVAGEVATEDVSTAVRYEGYLIFRGRPNEDCSGRVQFVMAEPLSCLPTDNGSFYYTSCSEEDGTIYWQRDYFFDDSCFDYITTSYFEAPQCFYGTGFQCSPRVEAAFEYLDGVTYAEFVHMEQCYGFMDRHFGYHEEDDDAYYYSYRRSASTDAVKAEGAKQKTRVRKDARLKQKAEKSKKTAAKAEKKSSKAKMEKKSSKAKMEKKSSKAKTGLRGKAAAAGKDVKAENHYYYDDDTYYYDDDTYYYDDDSNDDGVVLPPTVTIIPDPTDGYANCQYTASGTDSARENYAVCPVEVCSAVSLEFSMCNEACNSDPYLRLFDPSDTVQLYSNDDQCGVCSKFYYSFPQPESGCETYNLHMGCYSGRSCSGVVEIAEGTPAYGYDDDDHYYYDDDNYYGPTGSITMENSLFMYRNEACYFDEDYLFWLHYACDAEHNSIMYTVFSDPMCRDVLTTARHDLDVYEPAYMHCTEFEDGYYGLATDDSYFHPTHVYATMCGPVSPMRD